MNEPKVFRTLEEAQGHFGPCALTIGNFDGVHVGHQALVRETVAYAHAHGFVPSVLTFHPHPIAVLAPDRKPERLCSLDEKIRLLFEYGIRHIMVLPFTETLSRLSPREFVWKILANSLQTRAVFVGENFRFGHKQAGNSETLRGLGSEFGFVSQFVQPVVVRGEIVSSSAIRKYISSGNISRANRLLGRCFSVRGPVVSGHGVGAKQTVPTLNLRPVEGQVLPRGVFVTETLDLETNHRWKSITNIGVRPTFGGEELTIETYLLEPLDGASPRNIEVRLRRFVREERQFPNPEALKQQILKDVRRAQAYWRRAVSI